MANSIGAPDEDVHSFVNDLERPIGTYPYGRSLYEVMIPGNRHTEPDQPPVVLDTRPCGKPPTRSYQ
jgi:hypothetical protein